MKNTTERLEKLERILKGKHAPILKFFNDGLPRNKVVSFFEENGIKANESLIALYEWHNGIEFYKADVLQPVIELFPMGMLCTLDYIIKKREEIVDDLDYLELGDLREYLPLYSGGEDNLHLLKLTTGEIFYISPIIQILGEVEFKSIDSMLDCIIGSYEDGIFTIDPVAGLDVKYEEWEERKERYK